MLKATGGKGVNLAVNLVGGTALPACVRAAADFGRIIIVGYVDNTMHADFDLETVHGRRLQIIGISNTPLSPAQIVCFRSSRRRRPRTMLRPIS